MHSVVPLAARAALFCRSNHASLRDLPPENFWSAVRALPDHAARALVSSRLTAGLAIAAPTMASAATFNVTTNADTGAGSLRDAIDQANTSGGPDTITFAAALTGGQTITLASRLATIKYALTITGPGSGLLTIDGGGANRGDAGGGFRILYLYAATPSPDGGVPTPLDVTITGLTLQHGAPGDNHGGAIYAAGTNLTLDDVTVKDNTNGLGRGAGIYFEGSKGGALTIRNSTLSGNTTGLEGAALFIQYSTDPILLDHITVTGNTAGDRGGGVFLYRIATDSVTIQDSTISGNDADRGGGLIAYHLPAGLTVTRTTISNNHVANGGGGLFLRRISNLLLTDSTISGNTADRWGGGAVLYELNGALVNTTVTGNQTTTSDPGSGVGGGVAFYGYGDGNGNDALSVVGCTIAGNQSTGACAGLCPVGAKIPTIIANSIIAGNSSNAHGDAGFSPDDLRGPGASNLSVSYSLLGTPGSSRFLDSDGGPSAPGVVLGDGNLVGMDPGLGALADNGGPTKTLLPLANSPAINAGDPNYNTDAGPSLDQRGQPRISGGRIDMGAVERQPGDTDHISDGGASTDAGGGGTVFSPDAGTTTDGGAGKKNAAKGCACNGTEADAALALLAPIGALLLRRRRAVN